MEYKLSVGETITPPTKHLHAAQFYASCRRPRYPNPTVLSEVKNAAGEMENKEKTLENTSTRTNRIFSIRFIEFLIKRKSNSMANKINESIWKS